LNNNGENKIRSHATIKRARHKTGRDKIPISFSIPLSQIDWLDQHREVNQSHLVSSLLGDYIQTFESVQPDAEKLIVKRRALQDQMEKTEPELKEKKRLFYCYHNDYNGKLTYMQNIQYFSKLKPEQITVIFSKYGMKEVDLSYVDDKGVKMYVRLEYQGTKELQQVMATLQVELKKVEDEEYQAELEKLKYEKQLTEKIYNVCNQKNENIKKQIEEIERFLINKK
jgi:hypothetical protein